MAMLPIPVWGKANRKQDLYASHCPCKVTGCWGSVLVCLIPAPRGNGISPLPCPNTLGNFEKAIFEIISKTDSYLIPDPWKETVFTESLTRKPLTIL